MTTVSGGYLLQHAADWLRLSYRDRMVLSFYRRFGWEASAREVRPPG